MKKSNLLFLLPLCLLMACNNVNPDVDPEGTIYYTESQEVIANPERGIYVQVGYHATDIEKTASAKTLLLNRENEHITLYLHMYYLEGYTECDIPQAYLDRFANNMKALRESGAKCFVRFAYSDGYDAKDKPWDASPEMVYRHLEQLKPIIQEYADVICFAQAGFIGSWGEWYYTENFPYHNTNPEEVKLRRDFLDHWLEVLPADRQVCVRTPEYKLSCYNLSYENFLTAETAHKGDAISRIAGHNDCFLSSSNDVGTYNNKSERGYWAEDSKYTWMGGESCNFVSALAEGNYAIQQMTDYHYDYLHRDYYRQVLLHWKQTGFMDSIECRLGYRLVLDKAYFPTNPKAGETFNAKLFIKNVGFSAPINPRDVEIIFVSTSDPSQKFVYKQENVDPRFWLVEQTPTVNVSCALDASMSGEYNVYLNLPDPYPTLHDNPMFSIRLANEDMWEESTGYNKLTTIVL